VSPRNLRGTNSINIGAELDQSSFSLDPIEFGTKFKTSNSTKDPELANFTSLLDKTEAER